MATPTTCPDVSRLKNLAAGDLSPDDADQVEHHVRTCDACAHTLDQLTVGDTLTELLRGESPAPAPAPAVRELIARFQSLGNHSPSDTTCDDSAAGDHVRAKIDLSFLAPAEADGEIGRLGGYRILGVIGRGGMGVVLRGEEPSLERTCAIKSMLPEVAARPGTRERFLREAKAAAKVEHEHIIPIYQVGEDRGVPYIAMPLLQGMTLEDRLGPEVAASALGVLEILKISREIATGLRAAHEKGLIHRDIKPANIWLDSSAGGKVKILDFGLARLTEQPGAQILTQAGIIVGTPTYMAPEQGRGESVDARADLFSLGVVMYRLCTGVLPFKGTDTISTLMAVAMNEPRPPHEINPALPRGLSDLVMNLLEKNRERRCRSAAELIERIETLAGEPVVTRPLEQRIRAGRPTAPAGVGRSPRRFWVIAAGFAFLALLAGGIVVIIRDRDGNKVGELKVPDGGHVEIIDEKKGKPIDPAAKLGDRQPADDRAAALFVLSLGGTVQIGGDNRVIKVPADLPPGRLALTSASLVGGKATDAALKEFAGLKELSTLDLGGTKISDAGVKRLAGLPKLIGLNLERTKLTEAGLQEIARIQSLQGLGLAGVAVTDAGLKELARLVNLQSLDLAGTRITKSGLLHLRELPKLRQIDLRNTKLTAADADELHAAVPAWQIKLDDRVIEPSGSDAKPLYDARLDRDVPGWLVQKKDYYQQGFAEGCYFIALEPGSLRSCFCPAEPARDFVCEVVGRATGGPAAAWALELQNLKTNRFLYFKLNGNGELEILADRDNRDNFTAIGPTRAGAIRPGEAFNTLRVARREGKISVAVNGTVIGDPIADDFVKDAITFGVIAFADPGAASRAEFRRLTVWPSGASAVPRGK